MTTPTTRPVRGTNVFRDAVNDATNLSKAIAVLDGMEVTPVALASMHGAITRLLDSLTKVSQAELRVGDTVDMDLPNPDPTHYPRIAVQFSHNDDVMEGLDEEGFWNDFTEGDERTRAQHAFKSFDEETVYMQFCGIDETGKAMWTVNGMEDHIKTALLIQAGKI